MEFIKILLIDIMCILFPLCIYLIYLAYIKSIDKQEDQIIFSFTILISLLLLIFFDNLENYNTSMFFSIPLLISYLSKKEKLSILISIILICLYYSTYEVNSLLPIAFYTINFTFYKLLKNKDKFYNKYLIFFLLNKIVYTLIVLVLIIKPNNITLNFIFMIIVVFIVFISFTYLTTEFYNKSRNIVDINITLKELEKEKKLRASVFKLNHELKNPLTVCNGYLQMFPSATKREQEKYIEIMKSEIDRSLMIINDFSEVGQIKKLNFEEIDICLLLEDVREIIYPLYKKSNSEILIPDDEIYIKGDYNRLKQVFINILKNSYESKNNRKLIVKIIIKENENNCIIKVNDNGKGMSKEVLSKIYKDFFTTKPTGTGIGIPYIKEIIELHKGTLEYKSKENYGTTVIITLPK